MLANRGAEVIMAVRNLPKGEKARDRLLETNLNAKLILMELDLASLGSVKAFVDAFLATGKPLHILICNAGGRACLFTDKHRYSSCIIRCICYKTVNLCYVVAEASWSLL